jgi:hypothetical protein
MIKKMIMPEIKYPKRTEGPAAKIAPPAPKNNPVPTAPPSAIN